MLLSRMTICYTSVRWLRRVPLRSDFRPLVIIQMGFTMVATILLSLVVGLWLDERFGTSPWGVLVAMVVGATAGSIAIYRLISGVLRDLGNGRRRE